MNCLEIKNREKLTTLLKVEYNKNMEDLKKIFAHNLVKLRKEKKLTQLELANTLNYTDKNISKWEHAQALPTSDVLFELSKFFGVTMEFMLTEHNEDSFKKNSKDKNNRNHFIIICLSIVGIFSLAMVAFAATPKMWDYSWISFIYALVAASIVTIVLISIWFKKNPYLFIAISSLTWTLLLSIYLSLLMFANENYWFIFLIGIPLQFAILLISRFKIHK